MDEGEQSRAMARRIAKSALWMFLLMAGLVLLVWVVAVLMSPSRVEHVPDETPRDAARELVRDQNRTRKVVVSGPEEGNGTEPNGTVVMEYRPVGFSAGERAEYHLWYLKAQVGDGVFAVGPRKSPGEPWRFELKLSGMGGKFRYDAVSVMNAGFSRSQSYEYTEQFPLSKPRTVKLVFNEANSTVARSLNGETPGAPVALPARYFDPLSMIYAFREMDFDSDKAVEWTVTDGKSKYTMSAEVKGRERIRIGNKEFAAILVEPDLGNFRGIFNKGEDSRMQIWFEDSKSTLPLRIRFQTPIGEFTADIK